MGHDPTRRGALRCLGIGTGTLFTLSGGVLNAFDLAHAAEPHAAKTVGTPLFVQISDTHIGFNKAANPDVAGTLTRSIDFVNALPQQPPFILHTGDITHLSKPEEFDHAAQLLKRLKVTELHTVPGEHDVTDGTGAKYFAHFGRNSPNHGHYSFDHAGVHFVGLNNVMGFNGMGASGLASLGADQVAWLKNDLAHRPSSQPLVLFTHVPLWTIYQPWGWGTKESGEVLALVRRFGSVTVLNGHIHQIVQKVEGHIRFHTARSTAYPIWPAGKGPGPVPETVPRNRLPHMIGVTSVSRGPAGQPLHITDITLA